MNEWMAEAACVGEDPTLFDCDSPASAHKEAKAICARCPGSVRAACRNHAKRHREVGVWGGVLFPANRLGGKRVHHERCLVCGVPLPQTGQARMFCSTKCKNRAATQQFKESAA